MIKQVGLSNLRYPEWMIPMYFEQNLELTYSFFQNSMSNDLSTMNKEFNDESLSKC
jgi:hypothetical protein